MFHLHTQKNLPPKMLHLSMAPFYNWFRGSEIFMDKYFIFTKLCGHIYHIKINSCSTVSHIRKGILLKAVLHFSG
jgi:hypothetical protein